MLAKISNVFTSGKIRLMMGRIKGGTHLRVRFFYFYKKVNLIKCINGTRERELVRLESSVRYALIIRANRLHMENVMAKTKKGVLVDGRV